jgi:hypothetical protein
VQLVFHKKRPVCAFPHTGRFLSNFRFWGLVVSRAAVLVFPAAMMTVTAAIVGTTIVIGVVVVMVAYRMGIESQRVAQKRCHTLVRISGYAWIQNNSGFFQSQPGTAANSAANQGADTLILQKPRQGTMTAANGADNFGRLHSAIFHGINFKLFCVAKMLIDLSIFIGDCYFHKKISFCLLGWLNYKSILDIRQ